MPRAGELSDRHNTPEDSSFFEVHFDIGNLVLEDAKREHAWIAASIDSVRLIDR